MVRFGPGLEKRQAVLGRIVDIGADLLVMTAVVVRARMLAEEGGKEQGADALADAYCRTARRRISARFRALFRNDDRATYRIARRFLAGEFEWLEKGVVSLATYREPVETAPANDEATTPDEPVSEPIIAG
jgi:hypothetical protein